MLARRAEASTSLALLTLCVVGLVWHCIALKWEVVDDAAISVAFGRTFFEGEGFRATANSQPVEGFSNPLWTLLVGLTGPLKLSVDFARTLAIVFGALAVVALFLWGLVIGAVEVLPRVGYALASESHPAIWFCR